MRWSPALALTLIPLLGFSSQVNARPLVLDPAHSSVEFSVRHMVVSTVKGQFEKVKATIDLDDKDPGKSTVEASIDVASLNTHEPKRDEHLRSADFFDTAKYPSATFRSTKVEKSKDGKLKVTGELTMHGVTKPLVLFVDGPSQPMKDPFGRTVRGVTATGTLNRKDWGMEWNKALDTGGALIGDQVRLEINAELDEAPASAASASAK